MATVNYLKQIWGSKDLRKRILFTLGILVLYRLIAHITVPGADITALQAVNRQNELLQVFSLLTGGSTESFSIVLMGIGPYINASIIMQLMQVIFPKLESISKEGEEGRRKINSITRWLTLPLAFLQSFGMIVFLNTQFPTPIVDTHSLITVLPVMLSISAGTILLVWLGELITENGIGNGISLLIFGSIMAQIPTKVGTELAIASSGGTQSIIPFLAVVMLTILLITVVVLVNEGQRRVPITYSGRGVRSKSDSSFLPIRINQAGMIPIIFAVALISLPGLLGSFLANATSESVRNFGGFLSSAFTPSSLSYLVGYFVLTMAFTYFYVSITFNPEDIAEGIQKRGGYIPGIRPGKQTVEYLDTVSNRLTLFGSLFISTIAVLPILIQSAFSKSGLSNVTILISGASIIIIVGVILEVIRQVNASLVMHDYKKFY